jgi:hypothetical protein
MNYKLILTLLLFALLSGCNSGLLKQEKYNIPKSKVDIDKFLLENFSQYELTKTENDVYVSSLKSENGLTGYISYSLKSKEPVRKDETGNYYYRWSITVETFVSYKKAVSAFNQKYIELGKLNPIDDKGLNNRTIICDDKIYTLTASCLEGWHVKDWFDLLIKELLGDDKPDKNTIISCDCGGNISVNSEK